MILSGKEIARHMGKDIFIEPYDPRRLKRAFKGRGAELMKRDFPFAAEELARRLGVHAGNDVRLAFTKIGSGFWVVRLE